MLKGDVIKEMQSPIATPGFSDYPAVCGERNTLGGLKARTHLEPQKKMGKELCKQLNPRRGGEIICKWSANYGSPSKGNEGSPPKGKGEQEIPRRGKVNDQKSTRSLGTGGHTAPEEFRMELPQEQPRKPQPDAPQRASLAPP
jgi:hypothetical protein